MGWLFENFQILLVLGLALAAWLKNRSESAQEEESERRAREEMIRGLKEMEKAMTPTMERNQVPEAEPPQTWSTAPQPPPVSPPPLVAPEPVRQEAQGSAWRMPGEAEPAPWEAFEQQQEQFIHSDPHESPLLQRQREMQERLAEIKRETAHFKDQVAGARETQRRLERRGQSDEQLLPLGGLRNALRDQRQVKRAIVLREILGPPIGLKKQA